MPSAIGAFWLGSSTPKGPARFLVQNAPQRHSHWQAWLPLACASKCFPPSACRCSKWCWTKENACEPLDWICRAPHRRRHWKPASAMFFSLYCVLFLFSLWCDANVQSKCCPCLDGNDFVCQDGDAILLNFDQDSNESCSDKNSCDATAKKSKRQGNNWCQKYSAYCCWCMSEHNWMCPKPYDAEFGQGQPKSRKKKRKNTKAKKKKTEQPSSLLL